MTAHSYNCVCDECKTLGSSYAGAAGSMMAGPEAKERFRDWATPERIFALLDNHSTPVSPHSDTKQWIELADEDKEPDLPLYPFIKKVKRALRAAADACDQLQRDQAELQKHADWCGTLLNETRTDCSQRIERMNEHVRTTNADNAKLRELLAKWRDHLLVSEERCVICAEIADAIDAELKLT